METKGGESYMFYKISNMGGCISFVNRKKQFVLIEIYCFSVKYVLSNHR